MKNIINAGNAGQIDKILDIMAALSAMLPVANTPSAMATSHGDAIQAQVAQLHAPKRLGRLTPPKPDILVPCDLPADAFTDAAFERRWKPGRSRSYYLMGSTGSQALAGKLGLPLYKGGSVSSGRLKRREQELTQDQYASMSAASSVIEDGFAWTAEPLDTTISFLPGSPVRVHARDIRFAMPEGMTKDRFEDEIGSILAPISLGMWAQTPAGQTFLAQQNIDPATCLRLSPKQYGDSVAPTRVQELYVVRPRSSDVRALGRIIECIIYNFVMNAH